MFNKLPDVYTDAINRGLFNTRLERVFEEIDYNYSFPWWELPAAFLSIPQVNEFLVNKVTDFSYNSANGAYYLLFNKWNNLPASIQNDPRVQQVVQSLQKHAKNWYNRVKVSAAKCRD